MKLDISKAYEQVEWNLLEEVMGKLGFSYVWSRLVMRYVKTVSYSVMINGVLSAPFCPGRGLHQGDPWSPYLFLLCVEAFSTL